MGGFVSTDDRYIYYSATDPNVDENSGFMPEIFLMKVPKAGGPAQRVGGLGQVVVPFIKGSQKGRLFFTVDHEFNDSDGDSHVEDGGDVAVLDEAGKRLTRIVHNRSGLESLTVNAAGLAWVEGAHKLATFAEKLTLFTADLDGGNVRSIWKGSDSSLVGLAAKDSNLYLFLEAPRGRASKGPNGKIRYVKPGTFSKVLRIPRAGGTPQVLWKESDLLHGWTLDGDDLYVCGENGLFKLPVAGQPASTRVAEQCSGPLTVWHGWKLQWERTSDVQPILFGRVGAGGEMRELFHRTIGGAATDDQAVYVCLASADGHRCDLTRIDAAGLEARAKAPGSPGPPPPR